MTAALKVGDLVHVEFEGIVDNLTHPLHPESQTANWTVERAKLANLCRKDPTNLSAQADVRRRLRAARAEDYITSLVAGSPSLTTHERVHLATLLLGPTDATRACHVTFHHPLGGYWLPLDVVTKLAPAEPEWRVGDAIILEGAVKPYKWTVIYDGTGWQDHEGDTRTAEGVTNAWREGRVTRLVPEQQA